MALLRLLVLLLASSVDQRTRDCRPFESCVSLDDEPGLSMLQHHARAVHAARDEDDEKNQPPVQHHKHAEPALGAGAMQVRQERNEEGGFWREASERRSLGLQGLDVLALSQSLSQSCSGVLITLGGTAAALLFLGLGLFWSSKATDGTVRTDADAAAAAFKQNLYAYFFCAFLGNIGGMVMMVKLPYFIMGIGANGFQLSMVSTACLAGGMAGSLLLGALSDRVRACKAILAVCNLLSGCSYEFLPLTSAVPLVVAIRCFTGFATGTGPVETAFILDGAPLEQQPSILATQQLAISAGVLVGSVLNTAVFVNLPFQTVCHVMAALGIINSMVCCIFMTDLTHEESSDSSEEETSPDAHNDTPSLMSELANPVVLSLVSLAGLKEMGWSMVAGVDPKFWKDTISMDAKQYSFMCTISCVFPLVTCTLAPRIIDRLGEVRTCTYFAFLSSFSLMPTFIEPSLQTAYLKGVVGFGICKMLVIIAALGIISQRVPAERRGVVFALCATCEKLASMLGEPVGGALYDHYSQYIMLFFLGACMAVAGAGYALLPASMEQSSAPKAGISHAAKRLMRLVHVTALPAANVHLDLHHLVQSSQRLFTLDASQTKKLQARRNTRTRTRGFFGGDTIAALGNTFAPGFQKQPGLRRAQSFSSCTLQEEDEAADRINLLWAAGLTATSLKLASGKTQVPLPKEKTLDYDTVYTTTDCMLGEGSFGQVHPAQHVSSGTKCVVKSVAKAAVGQDYLEEHEKRDTFSLLLDISAERHPNVVAYLDFMMSPITVYVVMESLQGDELIDVLSSRHDVTEGFCRHAMQHLLAALGHIHSHGLIHRDVKVNALRFRTNDATTSSHDLVLYDFGHSCRADTEIKTIVGTALYMAPEVFTSAYSEKVDLWSAGVVLYLMLTADFPWKVDVPRAVRPHELKKAFSALQGVSENAAGLCKKLLSPEPGERISASDALKADVWLLDSSSDDTTLKVNTTAYKALTMPVVAVAAQRFKKGLQKSESESKWQLPDWVAHAPGKICEFTSFAVVGCIMCLALLTYTFSLSFNLKPQDR